jgi:uncharacterized protein YndB with AHSA1/START domain
VATPAPSLTFTRSIGVPPAEVFHLFTSPSALQEWCCQAAQVDSRLGGRLYLWWDQGYYTAGVFTEVTTDRRLAFTWRGDGDPAATMVQVDFTSAAGGGTRVTLAHTGLGTESAWASAAEGIRLGWEAALENLQSVLETGVDLRLARRPMFGLSGFAPLSPERAADLGVPVAEGLWIDGVLEGMGAHTAGIRHDDVLVRLDDRPITTPQSLAPVLAAHQAGDLLEAIIYRGPQQHRATVELSRRTYVDVELPASAQALAEATRAAYTALDREVDAAFDDVSEADADYHPAPDAWNAKQVLAHLIAVERDLQVWLTKWIEGGDLADRFHANDWTRLSALVTTYPTIVELVAELRRSEAATATMIATLPPEVARRKYLLHQLAQWIPSSAEHVRDHLVEVGRVVAAARTTHA